MTDRSEIAHALPERYPYLSDYLKTVFFEQGGSIHRNFEEAQQRFLASSSEDEDDLRNELLEERRRFYAEFATVEEQIDAFHRLGGAARSERALNLFLPQPE